jgi:hypothetical protein
MWERLPVGRPEKMKRRPWTEYGEEGDNTRYPTAAYAWDRMKVFTGKASALYKVFTNELDALTAYQVYQRASFFYVPLSRLLTNLFVG